MKYIASTGNCTNGILDLPENNDIDMDRGPQPMAHAARWSLSEQIADQLKHHFTNRLLAIGVYGSLARGDDGPYSDIEMHCVIRGDGIDTCYEWSAGPWKAEVDVISPDVLLASAAVVEGDWSITHGAYAQVRAIHDPEHFFPRLRQAVFSQPDEVFHERMEEVIVGDIYEMIGKIRNAEVRQERSSSPAYAVKLATFAACLQGLRHRHLFTSSGRLFTEAVSLADPPEGFGTLVEAVTAGNLADPAVILTLSNTFWTGLETWASQLDLRIESSLEVLLQEQG
jgi:kanamycin nucleotidyltransferase